MKPTHDFVLVRPVAPETKSRGGIVIPDMAQEKSQRGTIVAVGPGKYSNDGHRLVPSVHAGDEVIYSKYGGTEITVDGEELLLVRDSEILAITVEAPYTDPSVEELLTPRELAMMRRQEAK